MTEEQKKEITEKLPEVVEAMRNFQVAVMEAILPALKQMAELYKMIPEELREDVAKLDVDRAIAKAKWVTAEVGKYQKFWNADANRFEIDKGTPSEWICTQDELIADIQASYEDFHDA